jgi:hypothetical protein
MKDRAGLVDVGPAQRLADIIGVAKVILMALTGLVVLGAVADAPAWGRIVYLVAGVISIASIYVVFGWFEHTLLLLVGLARNTAALVDLEPGSRS